MRFVARPTALLLLAWFAAACSDTAAPQDFQPQEKTYALRMTTCVACDEATTPPLAYIFSQGVVARIAVENVTTVGADGTFLALNQDQSSLMQALPVKTFDFGKVSTGAYSGSVVYGEGRLAVSLVDGGCSFNLTWPGVVVGAGACIEE